MIPYKQLCRHDPENGIYGDCHRTCIASILALPIEDIPHYHENQHKQLTEWLNDRGLTFIQIVFQGINSLEDVLLTMKLTNPGIHYILGGMARNNVNHSVVCCDNKIVCDPAIDNSGITGPMDDGHYWIQFIGILAN